MIRTQIQLPDDLYAEAKQLCEDREMSFAELARRGIEHMTNVMNSGKRDQAWAPPEPQKLGWNNLPEEEIKRIAQEGNFENELLSTSVDS